MAALSLTDNAQSVTYAGIALTVPAALLVRERIAPGPVSEAQFFALARSLGDLWSAKGGRC